jgi:hypothetical protein
MAELAEEREGDRVNSAEVRAGSIRETFDMYVILVDREK